MVKVAKFGGSSVANAQQFEKIKNIIRRDPSVRIVVSSACGKIGKDDHKVTDLLYLCHAHVQYGMSYEPVLALIEKKYRDIQKDLQLSLNLDEEFAKLRDLLQPGMSLDELVSRGEYLTTRLLADYLHGTFVDAKDVIQFQYDGSIDFDKTKQCLQPYLKEKGLLVIPGFYGALPNGVIKVMSRGGSDITGAILANVIDANVYENWTDVSGMLVADPRIVTNPRQISRITYAELREMSYMGANVLHDESIFPVKQKHIPINIRNTNHPENPGTMILEDCEELDKTDIPTAITGITGKQGFTVITAAKGHSSSEVGFLRRALEIFEHYKLSIESVPIGVDSFSVIIESKQIEPVLYAVMNDLKTQLELEEIKVQNHLSLIAVVGRGMKERLGMSGKIFAELGKHSINIKTINQGADEISIIVGVDDRDFRNAIRTIYQTFILQEVTL
ncbi:MAG: aspartate kinase [Erysipelotrichaceae bacterium]|nr:aspartate kinase [Erysipelotrichaceae bacterium]